MKAKTKNKLVKVKKMTAKDKENLLMLSNGIFPGNRGYNRLLKAAEEGWFEIDESKPKMKKLDDNVRKFSEKIYAEKGARIAKVVCLEKLNTLNRFN